MGRLVADGPPPAPYEASLSTLGWQLRVLPAALMLSLILAACTIWAPVQAPEAVALPSDIPSFLGKTSRELKALPGARPGPEPTAQQRARGVREADVSFDWDGFEVVVDYDVVRGRTTAVALYANGPSCRAREPGVLLNAGKLRPDSLQYRLEFLMDPGDPSCYWGVKVRHR